MSLPHAQAGIALDLMNLADDMPSDRTIALVKTDQMEIIRMVLAKGKGLPEHKVSGEMSIQCLQGKIMFNTEGQEQTLEPGHWMYLNSNQLHSLEAVSDCVLLVTILFVGD